MSDLFEPQPQPPDYRPTPGYLPPELDELFSPPEPLPPGFDGVPRQPSTIPRQRGPAPPRQPPVITPRHAEVQPPERRRPKRVKVWWLVIAGLLTALLLAAGALVALNKLHLGPTSSSSASPASEAPAAYRAVSAVVIR